MSSVGYLEYVLEQLGEVAGLTYRKMMGEYLLYVKGVLVGGIYDDRLLIKKTKSNEGFNLSDELPYEGAKMMWMVDADDRERAVDVITNTYNDLKK